jgi:predicted nucleotidyltransferase
MHRHGPGRGEETRRRIAVEAARLISEDGIRDYHVAKRKAAVRLGIHADTALPKNAEIEEALREYQRLFDADDQPRRLRGLRESAREALRFFERFEPRLVGAVLDGSADRHSSVCLHVFSENAETVAGFLDERRIPYEQQSRPLRLTRDVQREFPAFVFSAGEVPVDVIVLPEELLRQAPLDRSGEKPMRSASLAALEELLAGASTA